MNTKNYTAAELGKLAFSIMKERGISQKEAYAIAKEQLSAKAETEEVDAATESADAPATEPVQESAEQDPVAEADAVSEPTESTEPVETAPVVSEEQPAPEENLPEPPTEVEVSVEETAAPVSEYEISDDEVGSLDSIFGNQSTTAAELDRVPGEEDSIAHKLIAALKTNAVKFTFISERGKTITTTGTQNEEKVPKCTRTITGNRVPKHDNMTVFFDIRHGVYRQFDNSKIVEVIDYNVKRGPKNPFRGKRVKKNEEPTAVEVAVAEPVAAE